MQNSWHLGQNVVKWQTLYLCFFCFLNLLATKLFFWQGMSHHATLALKIWKQKCIASVDLNVFIYYRLFHIHVLDDLSVLNILYVFSTQLDEKGQRLSFPRSFSDESIYVTQMSSWEIWICSIKTFYLVWCFQNTYLPYSKARLTCNDTIPSRWQYY